MSHDTHVLDGVNKDLIGKSRQYYIDLAADWVDPFGLPQLHHHEGFYVVRDDLIGVGSKGRFADLYVTRIKADHFVYVAPRVGYAGISLAKTCARHGRKLTLFCPASKEVSDHQLVAKELGAELKFVRVAAMPNLNRVAQDWAQQQGATFIPFGLRHELVTAAIVNTCNRLSDHMDDEPFHVWSAISTGVLARGLQIGWPDARYYGVAVARNLQAGEAGRSTIHSYPKPFQWETKASIPFNSVKSYDAKAYETMRDYYKAEIPKDVKTLFWNVAGELKPTNPELRKEIKSVRGWGDSSDLVTI
jgi:hypothetical protein